MIFQIKLYIYSIQDLKGLDNLYLGLQMRDQYPHEAKNQSLSQMKLYIFILCKS